MRPFFHPRYTLLLPHSCTKQLQLQELHQVVQELVEGIYVFNQVPSISFEPNHDSSSTCFIPSAYHDTVVGETLFRVDYFVKSLLHGSTVQQKDRRKKLNENWRKIATESLRENFAALGLQEMAEDEELGHDLYVEKETPFLRYPPKCVNVDLAYKGLSPRLSTGSEYTQQENHVSRDMFLRYLDHVSISLIFKQRSIQQTGSLLVLDPTFNIMTSVLANQTEKNKDLYYHLHVYLQKQRDFVAETLPRKKQIAHDLEILSFVSFLIPFLATLKKQNKVIDVSKLVTGLSQDLRPADLYKTDRELPPIFPSRESRWSPFVTENGYTAMHGGIQFHKLRQTVRPPNQELVRNSGRIIASASKHTKEVTTYTLGDQTYYILSLPLENYYSKTPKLPKWLHAMSAELKTQCSRLPAITDNRIQDFLKKPCGNRQASKMKTVNVSLQASIEKGVLPAVVALLSRCTKTRLNKVDEDGKAMIHYAAVNCRADVLSALLLAGSNVALPCHTSKDQPTRTLPLHLAAQSGGLETVCCLLRYGAEVSVADDDGWTPIHHAAFHNYQSVVAHFAVVEPSCIELETSDKTKATPLLLAAQNGCLDTVKCLVELRASVRATDAFDRDITQIAALRHHINILKFLIELKHPDLNVWEELCTMLTADPSSGYPEAAARCMDPLTRWQPTHYTHLLLHGAVSSLVQLLQKEEQLQHLSVQVLANLSNIEGMRSALVRAEGVPPLVKLLTSTSDRIQACSSLVLSDLATISENQVSIAKAGAIPHLVKLLESECDNVQLFSAACLGILAYDNPDNQSAIFKASGLPLLISLLGFPPPCIQACAACALQTILERNLQNQLCALSEGVIPPLVALLKAKEIPVHTNAARAIEALAENCEESQRELRGNSTCIALLKRMLMMREPEVKVSGGCALWAIAGSLISNKRLLAAHMGLEVLVDMLIIHNEKLDFVCSEALASLATELGDNQDRIATVGGVKPLVEVLTTPTSQRVSLSVIHTLAALTVKPALVPNPNLQKAITNAKGIKVLASIISSDAPELIRVEAACTLAKLILSNPENDRFLTKHTNFSFLSIFKFFTSSDLTVRLLAGYCLAIMTFNNSAKLGAVRTHGSLNIANFLPFLQSEDEFHRVHAAFQIVVLSKLLTGIRDTEAAVQGIKLLVELCSSDIEQSKVLSAEFLASLAHSRGGIPNTIIMAGALDPLMQNLQSGNGPVMESSCVALGYLTFNPIASRMMIGSFRDNPEQYDIFKDYLKTIVVSKKFLTDWENAELAGLPSLRYLCTILLGMTDSFRLLCLRGQRSHYKYDHLIAS